VAATLIAGLPDAAAARDAPPAAGRVTFAELRAQLVQGGGHLLRSRPLRGLLGAVAAAALGVSAANAVLPLYAVRTLGVPVAVVPTLWAVMSLGTLVAARVTARMVRAAGEGRVLVGALVLLAGGYLVVGAVPLAGVVWAAYAAVGFAAGTWNVLSATRRQRLTPDPMMGRVTSSYRLFAWGLMPLGAGLAGPLAVATSLGAVFLAAGVLIAATAALLTRPLSRPVEAPVAAD
jgi:MFS family permease